MVAFTLEPFHICIMKHSPMRRKLGPASRITITSDTGESTALYNEVYYLTALQKRGSKLLKLIAEPAEKVA